MELDGVRLLTDPLLRSRVGFLRRTGPVELSVLGDVDAVLISHVHYDHLDVASLRLLDRNAQLIVPRGATPYVDTLGFAHVTEMGADEEHTVRGVTIRTTHAEHDSRRLPLGRSTASVGYVVTGSACAYFAGDTDLFEGMRDVASTLDVAMIPIAGWGPRVPAGHLDPERAAVAVTWLRPRVAVPIHWGTYTRLDLRRDAAVLRQPADEFARALADLAPDVKACVLPVGGTVDIGTPA